MRNSARLASSDCHSKRVESLPCELLQGSVRNEASDQAREPDSALSSTSVRPTSYELQIVERNYLESDVDLRFFHRRLGVPKDLAAGSPVLIRPIFLVANPNGPFELISGVRLES